MKVILLQNIKGIGERNEVKNVKDGYGRNYLLPNGLAKIATPDAVKAAKTKKESSEQHTEALREAFSELQKITAKTPLHFQIKVGKKGEVFGSVTTGDIKEKLLTAFPKLKGADIKIKNDHIREIGQKKVQVDLGQGIGGPITIEIVPEVQM